MFVFVIRSKSLCPQVLWAQRKENIFITVDVQDAQDLKIDLEEQSLKFHGKSGENVYEFSLVFPEKVDKEVRVEKLKIK